MADQHDTPPLAANRNASHPEEARTALRLKTALLFNPGIAVVDVPYHLRD